MAQYYKKNNTVRYGGATGIAQNNLIIDNGKKYIQKFNPELSIKFPDTSQKIIQPAVPVLTSNQFPAVNNIHIMAKHNLESNDSTYYDYINYPDYAGAWTNYELNKPCDSILDLDLDNREFTTFPLPFKPVVLNNVTSLLIWPNDAMGTPWITIDSSRYAPVEEDYDWTSHFDADLYLGQEWIEYFDASILQDNCYITIIYY